MKMIGLFLAASIFLLVSGCNVVPKKVQYQKEEKDLLGNIENINPQVEVVEKMLLNLGYKPGKVDGKMTQDTRKAIKDFQESIGVKPTGYINEMTLRQLEDINREKGQERLKKSYSVEVRSPFNEEPGAPHKTWTTKEVQQALKNAGFDPGPVDGKMGPRTRQAVKEFQRAKGLKIDGIVGPQTWEELSGYLKE